MNTSYDVAHTIVVTYAISHDISIYDVTIIACAASDDVSIYDITTIACATAVCRLSTCFGEIYGYVSYFLQTSRNIIGLK
jgi:hypothetical protein